MFKLNRREAALLHRAIDMAFDENPSIQREYDNLKAKSIEDLKALYARGHKVSDLRGVDKQSLINSLLIDKFGVKQVREHFAMQGMS